MRGVCLMDWRTPRSALRGRRWRLKMSPQLRLAFSLVATSVLVALAFEAQSLPAVLSLTEDDLIWLATAAAAVLVVAAVMPSSLPLYLWHAFANALAEKKPFPVTQPWVIDGDTIDDRATGVRYRLANIDAPETGDNALCFWERKRGDEAKWAAVRLVRGANKVSVRRTFRTDPFGRRVAFVLIDGEDLGSLLVAQGLARPWRGVRRKWCGPKGGLALISRAGGRGHGCKTCGA